VAESLTQTLGPDVVLVAMGRTAGEALEFARRIRARAGACRVIGLAVQTGPSERQEAQRAGIESIFVIGEPLEALVDAICRTAPAGSIPKGDMP
jgi:DNA-binding NarL/FixJ family response regulator